MILTLLLLSSLSYAVDVLYVLEMKETKIIAYYIEARDAKALKKLGYRMKSFKWVDRATDCRYCPKHSSCCDDDGLKRRIGWEIWKKEITGGGGGGITTQQQVEEIRKKATSHGECKPNGPPCTVKWKSEENK